MGDDPTRGRGTFRSALLRSSGALLLVAAPSAAIAGPPYVTDDPDPTELGHWEIFIFGAGEGAHGAWDAAAGLDINYGAFDNVQLTATLPVDLSHEPGPASRTRSGAGDVELGIKYRVTDQEKHGITVSIFPRVVLPTGGHRFGTGRVSYLLPVWAEKSSGKWTIFGGGGYAINPGRGNRNYWQGGLALTREMSERLSLGAEATVEGADEIGAHRTTGASVGAVYRLKGPFALLASGGPIHEHHGSSGWRGYVGIGLAF